jgi:zinc protease
MKKYGIFQVIAIIVLFTGILFAKKTVHETKTAIDKNGLTYEFVTNDPTATRIYTLKNGLKIYLSVNKDEPRILGFIAVRAGSKNDPAETTGLAHYFEHLMFKGTDEIGTINWEKEKPLIEEISALFELHKNTADPELKKKIYAKIDSVSVLASGYASPGEYDKMVSYIGASGTNAWTSFEETVYTNEIPSNELERWLKIESERFSKPVFRLFHTELETVYEEFNMSQDRDGSRMFDALLSGIYQKHQYGTQTTLGKGEHLKNPSMVNIMKFFDTYYVPNNMAVCLSGDLDYEVALTLIEKYWGKYESKPVPEFKAAVEAEIKEPVAKEVFGPESESVMFGFRFGGSKSGDRKYIDAINTILSNGKAGLIDIELIQKQKVLSAYSWTWQKNDYSEHIFGGTPREGQTLEDVRDLLLAQIERIKKGDFDEWILEAAVNNFRLEMIRHYEENYRAYSFVNSFITNESWEKYLTYIDELEKLKKKDIVEFAKKNYRNNYVIVYKREGQDSTIMKVQKPDISPVIMNKDTVSHFFTSLKKESPDGIDPVFVNFKELIKEKKIGGGADLKYIKNEKNELFSLYYLVETGTNIDPAYKNALDYLDYLGTKKFSPEKFKQELFKNGLNIYFWSGGNRTYITISGLDKSLEKGLELMYDLMMNARSDGKAYGDYVKGVVKQRDDNKKDKDIVFWSALYSYAVYGENSPFKKAVPTAELETKDPAELLKLVKGLLETKHSILYYGPRNIDGVAKAISKKQPKVKKYNDPPEPYRPEEQATDVPKVLFVNFDMVQMNLVMLSKLGKLDIEKLPMIKVFNEYFDGGMSRLVFQEIREAQGLAYAAGASYSVPDHPKGSHYLFTYIMTQPDKFAPAIKSMDSLLNNMPKIDKNFSDSVENLRKGISTQRIIKSGIFWNWIQNKDKGISYDIRETVYKEAGEISLDKMYEFYEKEVRGKKYFYLIMADRKNMNFEELEKLGKVEELSLEQIFGY